jgi:hypothetical protein
MKLPLIVVGLGFQFLGVSSFAQSKNEKSFDEAHEKAAIVSTIEMETACYWRSDYECWSKAWSKNQVLWFVYWGELYEFLSFDELDEDTKNAFKIANEKNEDPGMQQVVRDNFNFHFLEPHIAMVWFDQFSTDKEGKCTYSREVRVTEKEDGQWRFVLMNALYAPSKPCDQK